jgi:hypothetical protein
MFVSPADIVPATGAIAPGASRIDGRFDRVSTMVSDLRSVTQQITVNVAPPAPLWGKVPLMLNYALATSRQQVRDQGGPDPFAVLWTAGTQPTHQITAGTQYDLWRFRLSLQTHINSGIPYTPVASADLNGSGITGPRAFVFDPARTPDPVLAQEMSTLMASSDAHMRECLRRSFGKIAGYNSCRTGWQVFLQPNINFDLSGHDPSKHLGAAGERVKLSLLTENAASLITRIFGLSNTSIVRATAYMPLDPTLLYVTGFDPTSQQFKYRVNQQFGDSHRRVPGVNGRTIQPPFTVFLKGEMRLGGPPHRTLAQGLGLVPAARGEQQPPVDTVKSRLKKLTQNPVEQVLALQDSLLLTEQQVTNIRHIQARFDVQADSLVQPVAEYVVAHGRKTDDGQLQKRVGKVQERFREAMVAAVREVSGVLSEDQRRRLPEMFRLLL